MDPITTLINMTKIDREKLIKHARILSKYMDTSAEEWVVLLLRSHQKKMDARQKVIDNRQSFAR